MVVGEEAARDCGGIDLGAVSRGVLVAPMRAGPAQTAAVVVAPVEGVAVVAAAGGALREPLGARAVLLGAAESHGALDVKSLSRWKLPPLVGYGFARAAERRFG